jgi:tartrate dehydratase beta subunit/fumarate hydratase class I family protein
MEIIIYQDKQFQLIVMNGKNRRKKSFLFIFNEYSLVYVMVVHGIVRKNIVHEHVLYLEQIIFKHLMEKIMLFEEIVNIF